MTDNLKPDPAGDPPPDPAGDPPPDPAGDPPPDPAGDPPPDPVGGDPWYASVEGIDDDTRKFLEGKKFADIATALKSGMHADQIARDRNVLPRPDPENIKDWEGWKELGCPEDQKDFVLERPERFKDAGPEDYDQGVQDAFAKIAHENRIPLPAAQNLLNGILDHMADAAEQQMSELETAGKKAAEVMENALRDEWPGAEFDKNKAHAERAAKALAGKVEEQLGGKLPPADLAALETAVGGSAPLTMMFHMVGEMIGEGEIVIGGLPGGINTPAAARAEISRLKGDDEHRKIMNDPSHPRHKERRDYWDKLNELGSKGQG